MKKDYSILIGGQAGQGSRRAGLIIAKLFNQLGYRIFIYDDYQSLIKGGHNFSKIRVSEKQVLSQRLKIDFLLALDKKTIEKHKNDLADNGIIIYNSDKIKEKQGIGVPIETTVRELGGISIMANTALISAFAKIIGVERKILEKVLKKEIKKGIDLNLKIARKTYNETKNLIKIDKVEKQILPLLSGNEAISLGMIKADLDLYIAYPMTPATGILHYLVSHQKYFNISACQFENEISVINTAIGGAFAGARTAVGTSGGGFALMVEALSLAAQSETPILIIESQRMSPASGVPTCTAQSDLLFTLTAGHGDFLRFVIAPGDAEQSFFWAGKALNLCWKYQTPSILLVDKEISESTFSFNKNLLENIKYEKPLLWHKEKEYKRYRITKNGISPLAFPGQKNIVSKANSYEHDEFGITVDDEKAVEKMQLKRLRKFQSMREEVEKLKAVEVYGNKTSEKAIVAWGSTIGPVKEIVEELNIKLIQPIIVEPFPEKQMKKALKGVKKLISVELNALGQMEKVLNCYGIKPNERILKYNGRPFLPEELREKISKIL